MVADATGDAFQADQTPARLNAQGAPPPNAGDSAILMPARTHARCRKHLPTHLPNGVLGFWSHQLALPPVGRRQDGRHYSVPWPLEPGTSWAQPARYGQAYRVPRRHRTQLATAPEIVENPGTSGLSPAIPGVLRQYPQRDSNPCRHLERVVSWATRRWGPGRRSRRAPPDLQMCLSSERRTRTPNNWTRTSCVANYTISEGWSRPVAEWCPEEHRECSPGLQRQRTSNCIENGQVGVGW